MEDNMWVVNKAHKCGMDDGELLASWSSAQRVAREREKKQQHLLTIPTAAATEAN